METGWELHFRTRVSWLNYSSLSSLHSLEAEACGQPQTLPSTHIQFVERKWREQKLDGGTSPLEASVSMTLAEPGRWWTFWCVGGKSGSEVHFGVICDIGKAQHTEDPRQVVLDGMRKQNEQAVRSKPLSSVSLWPLLQLLPQHPSTMGCDEDQ